MTWARPSLPPLRTVLAAALNPPPWGRIPRLKRQSCPSERSKAVYIDMKSKEGSEGGRSHIISPALIPRGFAPGPSVTPRSRSCAVYSPKWPIPMDQSDASGLKVPAALEGATGCPFPCVGHRGGRGERRLDGDATSGPLRFGHLVLALLSYGVLNKYKESLALLSSIRLHDGVEPSDFHQSSIK